MSHVSSQERHETTVFSDENVGEKAGIRSIASFSPGMSQVDLKDFFARPVNIGVFTWNQADAPGPKSVMYPWYAYFSNSYVAAKLANYSFLRCNLKIKILVNSTPFYYGAMLTSYRPCNGYRPDRTTYGTSATAFAIPYSQRPHVWLYPQTCSGGELTLPFLCPRDWLSICRAKEFQGMGELRFDVVAPLLEVANTSNLAACTVNVYAWAEDVELSGPTVGLAFQAGEADKDEYNGVISGPASALAEMAGDFKNTRIGKFATATQIGASAVAKISSLFGFSNIPDIKGATGYRPTAFPNMASVGAAFPEHALTLDPKAELGVSPAIVGLPSTDEMDISHLVQRESFFDMIEWNNSNATDALLFSTKITPRMFWIESVTGPPPNYLIQQTPMCFISRMFRHWRGDIIFRFRFVCTQYHKGRIIITWDPTGTGTIGAAGGSNIETLADTSAVAQTAIVDLGVDSDVEFRVPYHQALPWLMMADDIDPNQRPYDPADFTKYPCNKDFDNGSLTVRVQNVLTAPNNAGGGINGVWIMISVRGAENLEFANPYMPHNKSYSWFSYQAEETDRIDLETVGEKNDRYLRNFGEKITNLRELLQRRTRVLSCTFNGFRFDNQTDLTTNNLINRFIFGRIPPSYGYAPRSSDTPTYYSGIHNAVTGAGPVQGFNFVATSPLTYLGPAFLGYRGSTEWTFNVDGTIPQGSVRVYRQPQATTIGFTQDFAVPTASNYLSSDAAWMINKSDPGWGGQAITHQQTQAGLTVVLPMQTGFTFKFTDPLFGHIDALADSDPRWTADGRTQYNQTAELYNSFDHAVFEIVKPASRSLVAEWYAHVAAGKDFSFVFFLNVPTMFLYNTVPTI